MNAKPNTAKRLPLGNQRVFVRSAASMFSASSPSLIVNAYEPSHEHYVVFIRGCTDQLNPGEDVVTA